MVLTLTADNLAATGPGKADVLTASSPTSPPLATPLNKGMWKRHQRLHLTHPWESLPYGWGTKLS